MPDTNHIYEYDIAISFTNKGKNVAVAVQLALEMYGLKVYYYPYQLEQNLGRDLSPHLESMYSNQAYLAIAIICHEYFNHEYTCIEFEAMQKRRRRDPTYFIPILLEGHLVPHQLGDLTYFKWEGDPKKFAAIALKRLENLILSSLTSHETLLNTANHAELLGVVSRLEKFSGGSNNEILFMLGLCHYNLNLSQASMEKAMFCFERAYQLQANYHQAYYYWCLASIGKRPLITLRYAEIAQVCQTLTTAIKLKKDPLYLKLARAIKQEFFLKHGLMNILDPFM